MDIAILFNEFNLESVHILGESLPSVLLLIKHVLRRSSPAKNDAAGVYSTLHLDRSHMRMFVPKDGRQSEVCRERQY